MSTLHHSIHWPAQRGAATQETVLVNSRGEGLARVIYLPKDFTNQLTLLFSSITIGSVNEKMALMAKQTIQALSRGEAQLSNPMGFFYCNPTKTMGESLQQMKVEFSSQGLKKVTWENRKLLEVLGITQSKLLEICPKVEELVREFFSKNTGGGNLMFFGLGASQQQNRYFFHKDQKGAALFEWAQQITLDSMGYIYEKMGMQRLGAVELSEEAQKALGLTKESAGKMSCFQYALMMIDLETAKAFSSGKYRHDSELEQCLDDMDWRPVSEPDAGDLAVYYNHVTKKVMHAGVYKENGRVESKPGIANPATYEHGLYDVLGLYGTSVYFMRKSHARI
ncbi:hypothetical protein [Estrella lausannensis]|uniref:Uncharacterized protein n=1 Tax=Estrella lausannensis TaxID=483423 RepID=A0A0H5DS25_9BACT|nr:hypothetical protein [Estrella lausannensis]CRX39521.1 hypothetical protein ELAC_2201 [Estrella lausannensis]